MFSLVALQASSLTYYSNNEGQWVIGSNWVNGTFASTMTAGKYSVKAFDFSETHTETDTETVAVTDIYITVNAPQSEQFTFQITPNEGTGGRPVQFSGSGYPANTIVDIAYYDPTSLKYNLWTRPTTDASGSFSFTAAIPDLGKSNQQGDNPEMYNQVQFQIQYQGSQKIATYNQYARGIKSIGDQTAYGLYGNGSDLVSTFKTKAGDTFTITGKWFHQNDLIHILLDSETIMGTVTRSQWTTESILIGKKLANSAGDFSIEVTIPKTISGGEHYIAIEDSQSTVILKILITDGTLQISPSSGPGGAKIQFTGSGYPPLSEVSIYYKDTLYGSWNYWKKVNSDAKGNIDELNMEIPDLKKSSYAGDYSSGSSQIMFRTEINGKIFAYASYTQYSRGLKQVGTQTATALYGNGTDFTNYNMKVKPGDTITIAGQYFYPGLINIRWDGQALVNTVTLDQWKETTPLGSAIANAQGSFNTTITIPKTDNGLHWVSIEDMQTNFIIRLLVEAGTTPTPTPDTSSPSESKPSSSPKPTSNKPTPVINLQCRSIPIDTGYRVEISGTCSNNNIGLTNNEIQLYSSKNGGKTWEPLALVNTNNEGKFTATWISLTSGTFLIKAECPANTEYNSATATVNLVIEPFIGNNNGENIFTITSNSTISELIFNSKTSELSFIASGNTGSTGYVSINIPKTLIKDVSDLKVYLDGKELTYNSSQESDTWVITITYTHSTHTIVMQLTNSNLQNQNPQSIQLWTTIIVIAIIGTIITAVAIITSLKKKQHNKN